MDIRIAGEDALVVYLGEAMTERTNARVGALVAALDAHCGDLIVDLIPGYHSVVVVYDTRRTGPAALRRRILGLDLRKHENPKAGEVVQLPVYYGPESGPDLTALADRHGLSMEEVIALHAGTEYLVHAMGFAPGFAYLGEVDPRIATPRHPTPRPRVPRGAVAIADRQTAVYPAPSPGGWNLIGLCPVPLFDAAADPPSRCAVGDRVRFHPVSREEFLALGGQL